MDLPKVRPVAPGLVIASVRGEMQVRADASAKMAVLTKGLVVAVNAVIGMLLGGYPVLGIPETEMIGRHALALVALIALLNG
jgi:hypothetical protein